MATTNRERALMHLAQAATRTNDPAARQHIEAALAAMRDQPVEPDQLTCPNCERTGLPEQIAVHDCDG